MSLYLQNDETMSLYHVVVVPIWATTHRLESHEAYPVCAMLDYIVQKCVMVCSLAWMRCTQIRGECESLYDRSIMISPCVNIDALHDSEAHIGADKQPELGTFTGAHPCTHW
jgi:hypothetical protein